MIDIVPGAERFRGGKNVSLADDASFRRSVPRRSSSNGNAQRKRANESFFLMICIVILESVGRFKPMARIPLRFAMALAIVFSLSDP